MDSAKRQQRQKGQATIMVSLALLAMCGIMGLAVDFGWAFYLHRRAQTAADTAALAAVRAILNNGWTITCSSSNIGCESIPISCSSINSGNLESACVYAQLNGFSPGGSNNTQSVTVAAGVGSSSPPCGEVSAVSCSYWTTVRVSQQVPQLFSVVLGHQYATVAAKATAAITNIQVPGSLILLNRNGDGTGDSNLKNGTDLYGTNSMQVTAPGGIVIASNSASAGSLTNSAEIYQTPFTEILGTGKVSLSNSSSWENPYTSGYSDSSVFQDPTAGKGQPPITTPSAVPVSGGTLATDSTTVSKGPGAYYGCASPCSGTSPASTSGPLMIGNSSNVTFSNGGSFGYYVFFGGLSVSNSSKVTFGPGVYVFVGGSLTLSNSSTLTESTSSPGELLIFTNSHYASLNIPSGVSSSSFTSYGSFVTSNSGSVTLHGLNGSNVPSSLEGFTPFVIWQDQGNSYVQYTASGNINTSCGSINSPCTNASAGTAPGMTLNNSAAMNLYGAIYQPRGAWMVFSNSASLTTPLQIVTGAVDLQNSARLILTSPTNPVTRLSAALVE